MLPGYMRKRRLLLERDPARELEDLLHSRLLGQSTTPA